jgi:acyl-CoA synthetase (NDP forming)
LISQSGNIAMNLTMNRRSLGFTHVIGAGNQAVLGQADYVDALLQDDRVAAIGMYIEGVDDIEHFCRAALQALKQRVPIVVVKVGKTAASARQSGSHTSSLTGSDVLFDALCDRLGIIRVGSFNRLLETLKVLVLGAPLAARNIAAADVDIQMRPFSDTQVQDLANMFPNYVTVSNPFDYNTSIWGDRAALEQCFTLSMQGDHDAALLIYDHPTVDSIEVEEWVATLDAFIAAHKATGKPAFVVCTISELLPQDMRNRLIAAGIVPLQGLDDALSALSQAAKYREFLAAGAAAATLPNFATGTFSAESAIGFLDESQSKRLLCDFGLTVPEGAAGTAEEAHEIARRIGYPVVVKAVGKQFLHKSELSAVALNLQSDGEVKQAVANISESVADTHGDVERFLVERMVTGTVAELIIGVKRDDQFGPALVIGAGGVLVELIADSVSLLLPTDRAAVTKAIESLSAFKLIKGFRGSAVGDIDAIVAAVLSVAAFVENYWERLVELDINPLLVLPEGRGVVAADALIRLSSEEES